ncbi:MAG: thiamine pyrophosphate-dependent dehydrogenase E1 component subunit alpha [Candidatus Omnitrophota bacterium]
MKNKESLELFETMLRIRRFEEKICALYPEQEMRTPVHLSIGQEAVSAGVCLALKKADRVFGTHRSHGLYIAKRGNLKELAAELYGKKQGCSKGKGGSMHIIDSGKGVSGTTAIVGGNIPLAVGAALSFSMKASKEVACAVFGDGAVDEGVFFESMNFAALKKLPVLFVCENNFYAVHSHISQRQPVDNIYKRGECFGISGVRVDGNDAELVRSACCHAVKKARKGEGPSLIECRTYRHKTHVGPESDAELDFPPQKYLKEWLVLDPVVILRKRLLAAGILTAKKEKEITRSIDNEIESAFDYAKKCPPAPEKDLLSDVVDE